MRVGLTSAAFYGRMETEEAAAHLSTLPLDFCEIFLETHAEYNASFGQEVHEALRGLPCKAIHAKGTQFEADLFGASKKQRGDAFRILSGVLNCGQALGADILVFHGLPDYRGSLTPKRIPRLCETMEEACRMAEAQGLVIAWENVSWCALKSPEDALFLMESCPQLSFVLDIKQALQAGIDPFAFLPVLGPKLAHIHVLDWDEKGQLCLPGRGIFDFERFRRALDTIEYQGDVLLEPYAAQTTEKEEVIQSLLHLRAIFG